MSRTLTVFVCSTYSDLVEERSHVLDAIRRLQLQHHSMEFFGARSDRPIETCLAEVRRSDILVVIVGHRYGSLVPGRDISFPEAEYREGIRLGKPCLVYLRGEHVPVLPRNIEQDPALARSLAAWKAELRSRHTVAEFATAQELAVQVAADLSRVIQALEQGGAAVPEPASPPADEVLSPASGQADASAGRKPPRRRSPHRLTRSGARAALRGRLPDLARVVQRHTAAFRLVALALVLVLALTTGALLLGGTRAGPAGPQPPADTTAQVPSRELRRLDRLLAQHRFHEANRELDRLHRTYRPSLEVYYRAIKALVLEMRWVVALPRDGERTRAMDRVIYRQDYLGLVCSGSRAYVALAAPSDRHFATMKVVNNAARSSLGEAPCEHRPKEEFDRPEYEASVIRFAKFVSSIEDLALE